MHKILLLFTGGTICASLSPDCGKNQSHAKEMGSLLEADFRKSDSPFCADVVFENVFLPQDILSENMTVGSWDALLDIFRDESVQEKYDGVIVLHGTDTLAYTSSLLSLLLAGYKIPVCLVSAAFPLTDPRTNGFTNFRAAVELIVNGIAPNVYAVYKNAEKLLVHFGAHLLPCPNYSDEFESADAMPVPDEKNAKLSGRAFETDGFLLRHINALAEGVLLLQPYTNLFYDAVSLENVRAIVHGTYHAESVCIGRAAAPEKTKDRVLSLSEVAEADRPYSILSLLTRCMPLGIPVILAPCSAESCRYGTTKNALDFGARAFWGTTLPLAYTKVILGLSLGKSGEALLSFLESGINHEFVYRP